MDTTVVPFPSDSPLPPATVFTKEEAEVVKKITFYRLYRAMLTMIASEVAASEVRMVFPSEWDQAINLTPADNVDARALAFDVARALNATDHPIAKSFDSYSGKVKYTVTLDFTNLAPFAALTNKLLKVIVSGGEARCKVRKVVTKEYVPAAAAHYEERERYVIENPEECGASRPTT